MEHGTNNRFVAPQEVGRTASVLSQRDTLHQKGLKLPVFVRGEELMQKRRHGANMVEKGP
jgi:hypothetical protein